MTQRTHSAIAQALTNDNWLGYPTVLLYDHKVHWIEAAAACRVWTSMVRHYLEDRGHLVEVGWTMCVHFRTSPPCLLRGVSMSMLSHHFLSHHWVCGPDTVLFCQFGIGRTYIKQTIAYSSVRSCSSNQKFTPERKASRRRWRAIWHCYADGANVHMLHDLQISRISPKLASPCFACCSTRGTSGFFWGGWTKLRLKRTSLGTPIFYNGSVLCLFLLLEKLKSSQHKAGWLHCRIQCTPELPTFGSCPRIGHHDLG